MKKIIYQILLIIFIIFLLLISFRKIFSNDFWWHLKLGQLAWENKEWITKEMFSFTRYNIDWFNNTQIFDVSIWLIYKHFSYLGLFIFKFLCYLTTFFLLWKTIKLKNNNSGLLFFAFFSILSLLLFRSLYRPEIFTYLYTAFYLYALYKYKYTGGKLLYLIPLIQILWVNTHLSFVTGLALVGVFFGGELIRHLLKNKNLKFLKNKYLKTYFVILILTIIANFISPYGLKTISWFWWIFSSQESLKNVSEWNTPAKDRLFNLADIASLPYIIITWLTLFVLIKKIKNLINKKYSSFSAYQNIPWEDLFLFLLFLYQSLVALRFALISTIIFSIILIKNWPKNQKNHWLTKMLPVTALIIFMLNLSYFDRAQFGLGYLDHRYPENAVKFIKENKIPGNMANDYNNGGYYIWSLYPEKKIFMDGRTPNVYDDYFYWQWRNLANDNLRTQIVEDYQINFWLWPNNTSLPTTLWNDENWQLIYFDDLSTIYIKNTEDNQEIIEKFSYKNFAPYFNEKNITDICQEENLKENPDLKNNLISELEKGLTINPQNWLQYKNLALVYQNCQFNPEDQTKIVENLSQALKINPKNQHLYYLLGFYYLQNNQDQLAFENFKKAGKTQAPYLIGLGTAQYNLGQNRQALKTLLKARKTAGQIDTKYYQTLARVYYTLDKYKMAIEFHNRYLDLSQDYSAESYTDLAQSYFYDNQTEKAQEYLDKALELDPDYPLALEMQKELNK
ncbi:tetratricopeptide repeat protein [Candidatus Nomurabacteria bacterium]|nr:tetratricopeptide repeat protein [Candidatus Nomurabacteria bacterium]